MKVWFTEIVKYRTASVFFDISGSRARACMKKYSYSFKAYFDILPGRMPGRQKKD